MSRPLINHNGVTRPMDDVEFELLERLAAEMPKPEPTPEEKRMTEIEAALIELAAMLGGDG